MNFKEWFLKYGIWVFLAVMLFFPWVIGVIIGFVPNLGSIGTQSEWLSFWGSYAGAIIAVLGIYWQVSKQSQENREELNIQRQQFEQQFKEQKRQFNEQLEESRHQLEVQLEESRKNELNNAFILNNIKNINELLSLTIDINKFFHEELAKLINEGEIDNQVVHDTYNEFSNSYTKVLFSYGVEKENFSIEDLSMEANKLYNKILSNDVDSINKKLTTMLSISENLIINHKKELDNIKKQIL